MSIRKFAALEPISEPNCKAHNHQRRISVTRSWKDAASSDVKTIDLVDLAIPVYNSLFRRIRHSGRPRRVSPVDELRPPIRIIKQVSIPDMFRQSRATQFRLD